MISSNKYIILIVVFISLYFMCCTNDINEKNKTSIFERLKIPIFTTCVLYLILSAQCNVSQEIYTDSFFLKL
jgi:hypothetical protein